MLESVLDDFGIKGDIATALTGPVVTRYDLIHLQEPNFKSSQFSRRYCKVYECGFCKSCSTSGQNAIGVELPNLDRETVLLREILESENGMIPNQVFLLLLERYCR